MCKFIVMYSLLVLSLASVCWGQESGLGEKHEITVLNPILKQFLDSTALELKFKTFNISGDSVSRIGLGYSFEEQTKSFIIHEGLEHTSALFLRVRADGQLGLQRKVIPDDFLDTQFSAHLYLSKGGLSNRLVTDTAAVRELRFKRLKELQQSDSPDLTEVDRLLTADIQLLLRPQFYLDLSLTGSYEASQDFKSSQLVYGANFGFDFKPWGASFANMFDYPFALFRWIAGVDNWQPRATSFPTILIGLDRVDPIDHEDRKMAQDLSPFTRFKAEVAFRTPLFEGLYVSTNLRYYKELNPSTAILEAALDEHAYFTVALTARNGVYVSYTTGKLPFDRQNDQLYEIGWDYKLPASK